jgi:DNA excision repair protein ERCC-2
VIDFFYQFNRFCNVLVIGGEEFSYILDRSQDGHILKILCKDPSRQLGSRIDGFHSVIAMSATLAPIPFYRDVLGFPPDRTDLVEYPSPFPPENRKIMVVPEVSTKYHERSRYLDKTASIIGSVAKKRPGNYFVFFPSFQYLREVRNRLDVPSYEIISQEEFMAEEERKGILEKLKEPGNLILAIQGGIFAEGVDYPGEMLIGAIIVGPGLPKVSFEQELIKEHYQNKYERGFDYAYLYPGMNRVVQSAGRVIRSEDDVGIIVLLDKRFSTPYYSSLFPKSWYNDSPAELISYDYEKDLEEFWDSLR